MTRKKIHELEMSLLRDRLRGLADHVDRGTVPWCSRIWDAADAAEDLGISDMPSAMRAWALAEGTGEATQREMARSLRRAGDYAALSRRDDIAALLAAEREAMNVSAGRIKVVAQKCEAAVFEIVDTL